MSSRTYHDPLHGAIRLDRDDPVEAMAMDLIDSAPFQRLRRIRQLGPAFLTFHGAESSRFTHSLGVLQLARLALNGLVRHQPQLQEHRDLLLASALLHDIGHAPLSHSGEEMFGLHHEAWSARLIREHPQLCDRLEAHRPGIGRVGRDDLARIAHKARLQTTGGSDWHGWHGPLGSFTLPGREASSFLAALGEPPHLASLPA